MKFSVYIYDHYSILYASHARCDKNMGYLYLIISAVFKTLRINLKNALPPLSTFGTLI